MDISNNARDIVCFWSRQKRFAGAEYFGPEMVTGKQPFKAPQYTRLVVDDRDDLVGCKQFMDTTFRRADADKF